MVQPEKLKIYPSSAGFMKGQGVVTEYNSGCLRYIVAAKNSPKQPINPVYEKIGELHENRHAETLGTDLDQREVKISVDVSDKVTLSGRCDFITKSGEIHETKGSITPNFLYSVIRKGKYKISHLAQLTAYLIHFKILKGKIVTAYYKHSKSPMGTDVFTFKEGRDFRVDIDQEGKILVDGADSGHTVLEQYKHTLAVAEVLITEKIKDRPINHIDFSGPCFFCPLKKLCGKFDKKEVTEEEFKKEAITILGEVKK